MNCDTCKWWSALLAEARASKVYAPCLNPENTKYRPPENMDNWVTETFSCEFHETGNPVDLP